MCTCGPNLPVASGERRVPRLSPVRSIHSVISSSLIAPAIAFLLLAAHFSRSASLVALAMSLVMIALLFVKRPFAARTAQVALVLGAAEWGRAAIVLIQERIVMRTPYLRLALILGTIAIFTLLAALVFESRRMKGRYRFE